MQPVISLYKIFFDSILLLITDCKPELCFSDTSFSRANKPFNSAPRVLLYTLTLI